MNRKFCNKYTKIDNKALTTYHNAMSTMIQKPAHCKSCAFYTSRNCRENIHDKLLDEHNYFC